MQLDALIAPQYDYLSFTDPSVESKIDLKNSVELVRSVSEKHLDLLRPSRYYSILKGEYLLSLINNAIFLKSKICCLRFTICYLMFILFPCLIYKL